MDREPWWATVHGVIKSWMWLSVWAAAAAAAMLLQSCPTLCNPIDGSPPGSPVPGILQARTLDWVAISFSKAWKWKVKVKSPSCVRLLVIPWTAAYQGPPSMGFSRREYWSGLPLCLSRYTKKYIYLIPEFLVLYVLGIHQWAEQLLLSCVTLKKLLGTWIFLYIRIE